MGLATVLRKGENGEITHVYFCTIDGEHIYLSKSEHDKMLGFSSEQVDEYYSGEAEDEVDTLKEDISNIFLGKLNPEVIKYRIAISTGLINENNVIITH